MHIERLKDERFEDLLEGCVDGVDHQLLEDGDAATGIGEPAAGDKVDTNGR